MRIEKIVLAIEDAIEKRCYLPALALTLAIPDICAQYDYPKIYKKNEVYKDHIGQGAAYAKWYDENIATYNIDPLTQINMLDGWSCWRLRCGFLHNGSIDVDKDMSTDENTVCFKMVSSSDSNFDGTLGGVSSVSYNMSETGKATTKVIQFDIANFCGQVLAVLKHSYLNDQEFVELANNKMLNYIELEY